MKKFSVFITLILILPLGCSHNKSLFLSESTIIKEINVLQAELELIKDDQKIKKLEKVEQLNQALYKACETYCRNSIHHTVGHESWNKCMHYGKKIVRSCEQIRQEDNDQKLGDCLKGTLYVFD